MYALIAQLQAIQSDLVGIIIPVLLTSITAMITLVANSVLKIRQNQKKYNNEQFPAMQQLHSKFKLVLSQIVCLTKDMQANGLLDDLSNAVIKYVDFKNDSGNYRASHQDEVSTIDRFSHHMDRYMELIGMMHQIFTSANIPTIPGFHPIFKRKIRVMLIRMHYYSTLLVQYQNSKCSSDFIKTEIRAPVTAIQITDFNKYLKILDQWIWRF